MPTRPAVVYASATNTEKPVSREQDVRREALSAPARAPSLRSTPIDPARFDFQRERMTRAQAAEYLGVSQAFLEADAVHGRHGIPVCRVGSRVFYLRSALNEWLLARSEFPMANKTRQPCEP
jgi:hypothetical protein